MSQDQQDHDPWRTKSYGRKRKSNIAFSTVRGFILAQVGATVMAMGPVLLVGSFWRWQPTLDGLDRLNTFSVNVSDLDMSTHPDPRVQGFKVSSGHAPARLPVCNSSN